MLQAVGGQRKPSKDECDRQSLSKTKGGFQAKKRSKKLKAPDTEVGKRGKKR